MLSCAASCSTRCGPSNSNRSYLPSSQSQICTHSLRQTQPARRRASRCQNQRIAAVLDVTQSSFEAEVVKADKPVLLDFWAAWCGPCKLISPFMDKLEQEYGEGLKVVKIEADGNPELVEKYKVYGLPTVMLFRDGKKVEASHNEGAITLPKLKDYLSKHGIAAAATAS